MKQTRVEKLN